jgi:hypothetical protein
MKRLTIGGGVALAATLAVAGSAFAGKPGGEEPPPPPPPPPPPVDSVFGQLRSTVPPTSLLGPGAWDLQIDAERLESGATGRATLTLEGPGTRLMGPAGTHTGGVTCLRVFEPDLAIAEVKLDEARWWLGRKVDTMVVTVRDAEATEGGVAHDEASSAFTHSATPGAHCQADSPRNLLASSTYGELEGDLTVTSDGVIDN